MCLDQLQLGDSTPTSLASPAGALPCLILESLATSVVVSKKFVFFFDIGTEYSSVNHENFQKRFPSASKTLPVGNWSIKLLDLHLFFSLGLTGSKQYLQGNGRNSVFPLLLHNNFFVSV